MTVVMMHAKIYSSIFSSVMERGRFLLMFAFFLFLLVTMTWEKLPAAGVSLKTLKHSSAALGENIYVYGGLLDGVPTDDLMMFNTGQLDLYD